MLCLKDPEEKIYYLALLSIQNQTVASSGTVIMAGVIGKSYFLFSKYCIFFFQGIPGGHGKKGEMGRPVKFSLDILHLLINHLYHS